MTDQFQQEGANCADRLAELAAKADAAMAEALALADQNVASSVMDAAKSRNAAAHDALAFALVNLYRRGELVSAPARL